MCKRIEDHGSHEDQKQGAYLDCEDLLSDDRQHIHLDTVELIEAGPGASLRHKTRKHTEGVHCVRERDSLHCCVQHCLVVCTATTLLWDLSIVLCFSLCFRRPNPIRALSSFALNLRVHMKMLSLRTHLNQSSATTSSHLCQTGEEASHHAVVQAIGAVEHHTLHSHGFGEVLHCLCLACACRALGSSSVFQV